MEQGTHSDKLCSCSIKFLFRINGRIKKFSSFGREWHWLAFASDEKFSSLNLTVSTLSGLKGTIGCNGSQTRLAEEKAECY